jgi:hypothetical protein
MKAAGLGSAGLSWEPGAGDRDPWRALRAFGDGHGRGRRRNDLPGFFIRDGNMTFDRPEGVKEFDRKWIQHLRILEDKLARDFLEDLARLLNTKPKSRDA